MNENDSETQPPNKTDEDDRYIYKKGKCVLPPTLAGGPVGKGDPEDTTLRLLELQVGLANLKRDRAKEVCDQELWDFMDCTDIHYISFPITCRKESQIYNNCLVKTMENREFMEECKAIYLERRRQYRLTGVQKYDVNWKLQQDKEKCEERRRKRKKLRQEQELERQKLAEQAENQGFWFKIKHIFW